jgi:dUTP pyrophosphatase
MVTGPAAGLDIPCVRNHTIPANSLSNFIDLGVRIAPSHHYMLCARSSMGSSTPLRISNQVGIIDVGYRGSLMLVVDNLSDEDFVVEAGQKLCQIVGFGAERIVWQIGDVEVCTPRGEGGFGSTGF